MMLTVLNFGKLFIPHSTNLKIWQTKPLQLLHVLQVSAPSPVSAAPDCASLFLRCPEKKWHYTFLTECLQLDWLKLYYFLLTNLFN